MPAVDIKVELSVDMTCGACVKDVEAKLKTVPGVADYQIDLEKKTVVVRGPVAPSQLYDSLRSSGRTVIVRGQGSAYGENIGAAVCIFDRGSDGTETTGSRKPQGLARFVQVDPSLCLIDVTAEGLKPGPHALCVHELGDFSDGCASTGDCYDDEHDPARTTSTEDGDGATRDPSHKHAGDIATLTVDEHGKASLFAESGIRVWDVIGRSLVISELNREGNAFVKGKPLLGGIIARSAGLFENSKVVCACSGKTLWEEAKSASNL